MGNRSVRHGRTVLTVPKQSRGRKDLLHSALFDSKGQPKAYIAEGFESLVCLWDGRVVAYLYEEQHLYGMNGQHLGWFVDEVIYDNLGRRVGFTSKTCPVPVAREPARPKLLPRHEMRPRWSAPPFPYLTQYVAHQDLESFLEAGSVFPFMKRASSKEGGLGARI